MVQGTSKIKFVIIQGLPGSGKSTLAHSIVKGDYANVIRVNMDDIRAMLHQSVFLGSVTESNVTMVRDAIIRAGLMNGKKVISDDTNLNPKTVEHLERLVENVAHSINREIDIEIVRVGTSVKDCIENDKKRGLAGGRSVGAKVIIGMYEDHNPEWIAYE